MVDSDEEGKGADEQESKGSTTLLDSIADWAWEMDTEGVHTYSNSAVEDILGYEVEEVIGKAAWEFWPDKVKESIDKDEFKERLKKGEGWESYPGRFKHKDGSIKYLESTAVPIYDQEGELKGYRGIDRDITERKKSEKKEELLHSILRHDIKNKLQITKAYLQLMEDEELSDEARELLSKAESSVKEEEKLIHKVNKLRKIDKKDEKKTVGLKRYIDKSIDNVNSVVEKLGVKIKTGEVDAEVLGGELLEELFTNLFENSLKHSGCEEINISKQRESDEIIVILEDDGKGIPDEEKDKILEKRYKGEKSKGSGLGLFLVKSILDSYQGDISIEDSEMGGAKFEVSLKKA